MTLLDILKVKGNTVFTISPNATLREATQEMVRQKCGSLVVCDRHIEHGEVPMGIISERDILRFCAAGERPLESTQVREVMTTQLIAGAPLDSVEATMGLMTTKRVRHLPVLVAGRLVGMVSIGDLVKSQFDRLAMENQFMKNYITG
jgi:CBS domain-containing protein